MSRFTRFLDALSHIVVDFSRINQALIIGPGITDPIEDMLILLPAAHITLVDADPDVAAKLQVRWRDLPRLTCLCADASASDVVAVGQYDLLVIRHPDIARRTDEWSRVLRQGVRSLSPDGHIVVTTYSLDEIEFVWSVFPDQSVSLIPGAPYTSTALDLQGNDRYIAAYQRSEQAIRVK
jgi:hypothetical protein